MSTISNCWGQIWNDTSPEYRIAAAHVKPPRCAAPIRRIQGHRTFACEDRGEESVGKCRPTAPHAEELGMKLRSPTGSPLNDRYRKGVQ